MFHDAQEFGENSCEHTHHENEQRNRFKTLYFIRVRYLRFLLINNHISLVISDGTRKHGTRRQKIISPKYTKNQKTYQYINEDGSMRICF